MYQVVEKVFLLVILSEAKDLTPTEPFSTACYYSVVERNFREES